MLEAKLADWTARLLVAPHPSILHVFVRNSQIFPDMSACQQVLLKNTLLPTLTSKKT